MNGRFRHGCPFVDLEVETSNVEALLDTGFNGALLLPSNLVDELKLTRIGEVNAILASGKGVEANVYFGKIRLFGKQSVVRIVETASNVALAGMDLFHECRIVIERHRNLVEVTQTL